MVLDYLQGMPRLRRQVQSLLHLEPGEAPRVPLARSTDVRPGCVADVHEAVLPEQFKDRV